MEITMVNMIIIYKNLHYHKLWKMCNQFGNFCFERIYMYAHIYVQLQHNIYIQIYDAHNQVYEFLK